MKRIDLIRHLERHECELLREGSNHTMYVNRQARRSSAVPRHREVNDFLARKICDDLSGVAGPLDGLNDVSSK
jgi:mRNA interferase HicA